MLSLRSILLGFTSLILLYPSLGNTSLQAGLEALKAGQLEQAIQILEPLALEHNNAKSALALALLYEEGTIDWPKDETKALHFYEIAAKGGIAQAQTNLGLIYAMGTEKIKQDEQRARELWTRAAQQGEREAAYNLGVAYLSELSRNENNIKEGIALIHWSAKQGSPSGQLAMARLYESDLGLDTNLELSLYWYSQNKTSEAQKNVKKLKEQGIKLYNTLPQRLKALLPQPPKLDIQKESIGKENPTKPMPSVFNQKTSPKIPQKPKGFFLWFATVEQKNQAKSYWAYLKKIRPDIFTTLAPYLEAAKAEKQRTIRLLAGPIEDKNLAWKLCNIIKLEHMSLFCQVRELR